MPEARNNKATQVFGKTKHVRRTGDTALLTYSDNLVGDGGARVEAVAGKGAIGAYMTAHLCSVMDARSIPTHYIRTLSATTLEVRWLDMLALEVVVRGAAMGSFSRRYGLKPGHLLPEPVVELFLKNDALDDPLINAHATQVLGYADAHCLSVLTQRALDCWQVVSEEFARASVRLLDIKFEFGLLDGELRLGDEIGFDTLRLCDRDSGRRLDKDVWYLHEPGVDDNLKELRKRLRTWDPH